MLYFNRLSKRRRSAIKSYYHYFIFYYIVKFNLQCRLNHKDTKKYATTDFTARYAKIDEQKHKLENVYYEILDGEDLTDELEATYTKNYEKAIADYNDILVAFEKLSVASALPETAHPSATATPANVLPKIALSKFSSKIED